MKRQLETALEGSSEYRYCRQRFSQKTSRIPEGFKSGRATFLPMDTVSGSAISVEGSKTASSVVQSQLIVPGHNRVAAGKDAYSRKHGRGDTSFQKAGLQVQDSNC